MLIRCRGLRDAEEDIRLHRQMHTKKLTPAIRSLPANYKLENILMGNISISSLLQALQPSKYLLTLFTLMSSVCIPIQVSASESSPESLKRVSYRHVFDAIGGDIIFPRFVQSAPYIYYSIREGETPRFFIVDLRNGKKREMIQDYKKFARSYAQLTGDTVYRNSFKLFNLEMADRSGECFRWERKGWELSYHMSKGVMQAKKAHKTPSSSPSPSSHTVYSSDSLYRAIAVGDDVYIEEIATKKRYRMTDNTAKRFDYFEQSVGADPDSATLRGQWHGHTYVLFATGDKDVEEVSLIQSIGTKRPKTRTFKMPMPADKHVRQYSLLTFNAENPDQRPPEIDKYTDQEITPGPCIDSQELYFTRTNRVGNLIELCRINFKDNSLDVVIQEKCHPHYNPTLFNYRVIRGGKQIVWWSERTGYGAYYLYSRTGKLLKNITAKGTLVAGKIKDLDEKSGRMIIEGYGAEPDADPTYRYHYVTNIDRGGLRVINGARGYHDLTLSEDGRYALDSYSRMDLPPVYSIIDLRTPGKGTTYHTVSPEKAQRAGWVKPELMQVKAADGKTNLYGILYKPHDFDPKKRYPLISYVYPGPQTDLFPLEFTVDDNENQQLAECGFLVWQVSARGSNPYRGKAFSTFGYGNLRDYPLADCKYAIEQVAQKYPQADLSRVGIYGHSGGGFQTVTSMLTYPDFYKVGIAASGNYDNNIYIQWWVETYHGVQEHTDSVTGKTVFECNVPTPMELAKNLKGNLLLMVGDVDKNIPPSSTYRMADALIKAGKRFDMMILPGKGHQVFDEYYFSLMRAYFLDHLIKPEPKHIDILHNTDREED